MTTSTLAPWGLTRLRRYPSVTVEPYTDVVLDPHTQVAVFLDQDGRVVDMGKHGTAKGTETKPESTNQDSRNDTDHDQDSEQD
ncbi:putative ATP-grasp-modified RiPP [Kitasatospora sp. NPDC001527]|uniref:putative ATP-grasp-modified RiPP n=1 Tax=Kitasatospora sp. NPDC001527 TaxID=3154519 RepID=UPI0033165AFA